MRAVYGFAAASVLALSVAPAMAGALDEPVVEPVAAPAPAPLPAGLWSGAYGGAQLGYGDLDADGSSLDDTGEGAIGGLHVGWQNTVQNFVYGVELDANATDIDLGGTDLDSLSRVKAKAGYDLGRSLVYATAGGAYADTDGGDDWGYAAGVGYDYRLTDRVSLGAEATYHWFDDFDNTGSDIEGTTLAAKLSYHF